MAAVVAAEKLILLSRGSEKWLRFPRKEIFSEWISISVSVEQNLHRSIQSKGDPYVGKKLSATKLNFDQHLDRK